MDNDFKYNRIRKQIFNVMNQLSSFNDDYRYVVKLCYKKTNILLANYIIENNDSCDLDISIKIKSKF